MPYSHSSDPGTVHIIRDVFRYLSRFQNRLFVLKIEDTLIEDAVFPMIIQDIVQLHNVGINIIIVPGTKKTIEKHLEHFEIQTSFENGYRITPEEAMPMVRLAAMEVADQIITHLAACGATGMMGNWVRAKSKGVINGVDYQSTGQVTRARSEILKDLLQEEYIPVIPGLGWSDTGTPYNISSSELASQLCKDLEVEKVFFIGSDLEIPVQELKLPRGVPTNQLGLVSDMDLEQTQELLENNAAHLSESIQDYLAEAINCCQNSAHRVHIINGSFEGSMLKEVFSTKGDGTMIFRNQYYNIRKAMAEDVPWLLQLMQAKVEKGLLVARTEEMILAKLEDYLVYELDGSVKACGALHVHAENIGEIAAIAVDETQQSHGMGKKIVKYLLRRAHKTQLDHVYLLTTQAEDWFQTLGFVRGTLQDLPEIVQKKYNKERNSKILIHYLHDLGTRGKNFS